MKSMYENTVAVLSTKHQKELILAKPFLLGLGISVVVPSDLDTDILGTFTGEIARTDTMENTVIKKAKMGMESMSLPFGLASEGSFGTHPHLPYMGSDYEMLGFVDHKNDLVFIEKYFTYKTNFGFCEIKKDDNISGFLEQVGFPRHGLIVRPKYPRAHDLIYKGIVDPVILSRAITHCANDSEDGVVHVETDMRAHMNPTRREVIRQLAFRLIRRLRRHCPACDTPGLGLVDTELGLPCEDCGMATEFVQHEILGCVKCDYRQKVLPKRGLEFANPQYCHYCNP